MSVTDGPQRPIPTVDDDVLQALRDVNVSIAEVAAGTMELATAIRSDVRTEMRNTRLILVPVLIGMFVLIVIAFSNLYLIRAANESSFRIYDCTAAEGECYQRGRRTTAGAVNMLTTDNQLHEDRIIARLECIRLTGVDCPPQVTTTTTQLAPG